MLTRHKMNEFAFLGSIFYYPREARYLESFRHRKPIGCSLRILICLLFANKMIYRGLQNFIVKNTYSASESLYLHVLHSLDIYIYYYFVLIDDVYYSLIYVVSDCPPKQRATSKIIIYYIQQIIMTKIQICTTYN